MNIAVITGATSGIGRECYRMTARYYSWLDEIWCIGRNIRNLASLPAPKGPKLKVFRLDLTKEEDLRALKSALRERENVKIKLLINAAGCGKYGRVAKTDPKLLKETVRVNCEALTAVTCLCLPYMRRKSRILEISSGAAFFPQPDFAVYSASKAYVLNFSMALGRELKDRGITVTAVCPGPVDTPFLRRSREGVTVPGYKQKGLSDPAKVAYQALYDGAKGRKLSLYGLPMKGLYLGTRFLPPELFTIITDYLNTK